MLQFGVILLFITRMGEVKNPDETRGRHFKGRNRRDTGQEEGAHICFTAQSGSVEFPSLTEL